MSIISAVSYIAIGLAGCSVGPEISRGAHKLTRTPRVIKIKKGKHINQDRSKIAHMPFFFICR